MNEPFQSARYQKFFLILCSLGFLIILIALVVTPAVSTVSEARRFIQTSIFLQANGWTEALSSILAPADFVVVTLLGVHIDPVAAAVRILSILAAVVLLLSGVLLAEYAMTFPGIVFRRRFYFFYFLIFASSVGYMWLAGNAPGDMLNAVWMNLALITALLPFGSVSYPALRWRWYALSAACTLLASLSAGLAPAVVILLFFVIGLSVLQSSKIALIEGSKLAVLMLLAGVLFTCFVAFEGRELARMLSNFAGHKFSGSGFYSYQYMPHSVFCYFLKILMLGGAWTFLLPWALWKSTESCRLGGPGCFGLAAERRWSAALLWGVAVIAVLLYPAPVESSAFLIALLPTFAVGLSVMLSFTIETHSQWFLARWLPELYRMAALLLQVIAISYLLLLGFAQSPYTGWLLWLDEVLAYLWKHALLIFPAAVLALLTSRIALRQLFSPAFPLAVAMLIALPVYIGTGIRAEYQEFPYRAQEIQRHLDQQETLLVVAAENSQELYPLLYYLRNQFRQVNPDITGLACPGLYLSTGAWLESQNSVPGNVVIVARSRSSLSRRDAGLNDEVLIFRCLEEVPRAAI